MTSSNFDTDVAIIGAGTAGISALNEIKKTTDRVVLFESGELGTMCARTGCMPSKALIEWARDPRGREGQSPFERVRELRDYFVASAKRSTEERAPRIIREHARITGPNEVRAGDQTVRAKAIIIATGSTPIVPDEWRATGDRAMTTETFFEQITLPTSCAIIGTGPVGLELGQALARLGVKVSIFGRDRGVGGLSDPVAQDAAIQLIGHDCDLYFGPDAQPGANHTVVAGDVSVAAERVLLSVGRRPNLDNLGLDALGVALDDRGVPKFDPVTRRVGDTSIFIAGDVAGDRPVQHEAAFQGRVAGYGATVGGVGAFEPYPKLLIAFTKPNIAVVGQTGRALEGRAVFSGQVDFANQGRARLMGEPGGVLRIYADARDGLILGAEMVCPAGEHLAHLLALAVARKLSVNELLKMPFYHPTLEEGVRTALVQILTQLKPKLSVPEGARADVPAVGND